jgi:hypothetical protein
MANFCIPKNIVEKISQQLDDTSISKLFDMSSEERVRFFATHSNTEIATNISRSFDDILSEAKRDALEKALKTLGVKDADTLKKIKSEIRKFSNNDLLDPAKTDGIIKKITSIATGSNITEEETKIIVKFGSEVEKYKSVVDVNNPVKDGKWNTKYGEAFYEMAKKQEELNKFLVSKVPISKTETFWSHAKASMLLKPASWLVNIISNTENAALEAISKRVGVGRMGGYNSDITKEWKTMMAKIYKETGNDYSRSLSLDDMVTGNGKALGEISNIGKDTWLTNLVYKYALGSPDAWSARMNFADSANLYSSKLADGLGLTGKEAKKKAGEILSDSLNVIPKTEDGRYVRELSVADALRATYTNESWAAKFSLAIKKAINSIPGFSKVRPGDLLEPFVKTPANVVEQGLDIAGLGYLKATAKTIKYFRTKNIDEKIAKQYLMGALKDGSKATAGIIPAFLLAATIGTDNYMGAYDPQRSKWEQLRNSNYNAIKVGNKWISLDYLGPVGTPLIAMLEAKKYGKGNILDTMGAYLKGAFNQSTKIPFISSFPELYAQFQDASDVDKSKFYPVVSKWFTEQIASRVPGILADISKMTDTQIRDTSSGRFGKFGLNPDPILAKLPWVATFLPGKTNILGEPVKTEQHSKEDNFMLGLASTILSGARIKTEQQSTEGKEIYRLFSSGNAPTITNWKYIQSSTLQKLKDKVGTDKFNEIFINEYGPKFKSEISKSINTQSYKSKSDKDKKKEIDLKEDMIMNSIYNKYGISRK